MGTSEERTSTALGLINPSLELYLTPITYFMSYFLAEYDHLFRLFSSHL